jgi:hypothetical protein
LPDGSGNIVSFPISPSPGASNYLVQYSGARINEVLAINESVITNSAGRTPDWIELRNTNAIALDLSGMRLSTDAGNPAQWVFPAGVSIPANGYLVVWFDNERAASTPREVCLTPATRSMVRAAMSSSSTPAARLSIRSNTVSRFLIAALE